jgi:hypothetical protein
LRPRWPLEWLATHRDAPIARTYVIPIAHWYGAPLALAALKWRRPEARLLVCMAVVPQTAFLYDQFGLFLIPRTRFEMLALVLLSLFAIFSPTWFALNTSSIQAYSISLLPIVVAALYLPSLMMVLSRPNTSSDDHVTPSDLPHPHVRVADTDSDSISL